MPYHKRLKKKPWDELKEDKCPKCGTVLTPDLFNEGILGCSCNFDIKEKTKDLLVNRFQEENNEKI